MKLPNRFAIVLLAAVCPLTAGWGCSRCSGSGSSSGPAVACFDSYEHCVAEMKTVCCFAGNNQDCCLQTSSCDDECGPEGVCNPNDEENDCNENPVQDPPDQFGNPGCFFGAGDYDGCYTKCCDDFNTRVSQSVCDEVVCPNILQYCGDGTDDTPTGLHPEEQCYCPFFEGGEWSGQNLVEVCDDAASSVLEPYCGGGPLDTEPSDSCDGCACDLRTCGAEHIVNGQIERLCDYTFQCGTTLYICWPTIQPDDLNIPAEITSLEYCNDGMVRKWYQFEGAIACGQICNRAEFTPGPSDLGSVGLCPNGEPLMQYTKICPRSAGQELPEPSCDPPDCWCQFSEPLDSFPSVKYDPGRNGAGRGDPHFMTWHGEWYDFHGICDMVLAHSEDFAGGLGLDIHLRTKARYEYSYIEAAAIKIGDDILEVGSWGEYWFNGVEGATLSTMGDGFPVTYKMESKKKHEFVIETDKTNGERIVVSSFKDMVSVNVENATMANFGSSVGLMGNFMDGSLVGRDGVIIEDHNLFGQNWQVLESEAKLFQSPPPNKDANTCFAPAATARRRLGERVPQEAAEDACSHTKDEKLRDMCVFDVMAMDDLEVAAGGAY